MKQSLIERLKKNRRAKGLQYTESNGIDIVCNNELETRELGLELALSFEAGDVVALTGDLGTGKTTVTKAIADGLGIKEQVTSPTFNIIKEYSSGRLPLYHFDVYRLGSSDELYDLGADDYLYGDGVCVVEWADIVWDAIPEDALWINIEQGEDFECRYLHLRQQENTVRPL